MMGMSVPAVDQAVLADLRGRIQVLQGGPGRADVPALPVLPFLSGLVRMPVGSTHVVDTASLAMALAAGASRAGEWVGFVGWDDFGAEAARQLGLSLDRTVVVPRAGEHWLEVTAALIDVVKVVVLRPQVATAPRSASILDARLRARSGVLVVHGPWPRSDTSLHVATASWEGLEQGHGRLRRQRLRVEVRGSGRPRVGEVTLPFPEDW